jgi:hypothetical protein
MYVRAGPFTADPTDSYVQARTAPQTRRQKHLGAGSTNTGERQCGDPQPEDGGVPGQQGQPDRGPGLLGAWLRDQPDRATAVAADHSAQW